MAKSAFFQLILAASAALVAAGCGGDTSPVEEGVDADDDAMADDDSSPTPEPSQPAEPDPGADDPPWEMTPEEDLPEGAYPCDYARVPNEKITDFSLWDPTGTTIWGDDMSLTGGEFTYQNEGSDPLTIDVDTAAGTAHITGTVQGYAGWGLWFGVCTNASRWSGIRFTMGGDLGVSGELAFQVQTNNNYPIDISNSKGACAGAWGEGCDSGTYIVEEFPAEPAPIEVPWSSLTGGAPNELEPAELLGLQWQFNCAEGDSCELDVIIDVVEFY